MEAPITDSLGQRLDRIERENRRLKRVIFMAFVGFAALVLLGQSAPSRVPKVVEAEKFVLRDTDGRVRATLEVLSVGDVVLGLNDKNGRLRVAVTTSDRIASLFLWDVEGEARASLEVAGGSPSFRLQGRDGISAATLGVDPPLAHLVLVSPKDAVRGMQLASLGNSREHDRLGLHLWDGRTMDKKFNPRAAFELASDGSPSLVLQDENGKGRAVLGHTALEATRTGTVEQRPASSLVLFDKDGKVLWEAP